MPIAFSRAEDMWVWDVEGERYLDCIEAFATMCQGHPRIIIINAMIEQIQRVTHMSRRFTLFSCFSLRISVVLPWSDGTTIRTLCS